MACQIEETSIAGTAVVPATFSELLDDCGCYSRSVRNLAPDTVKEQRVYVERFLTASSVSSPAELFASVTWVRVRDFIFEYPKDHGPGSRRRMQSSLRAFLRFCHARGYLSCDHSSAVPALHTRRLSSIPKSIDDETVHRLLESIDPEVPSGLRDLAVIELLTTYGVCGIQVRQLRLDEIDWADSRTRFRAVKGGKTVVQHLTPQVGNRLLAYIRNARPNDTAYAEVFLTVRRPFHLIGSSGSFSSIIVRRLRQIDARLPDGVSHGGHSFRHAFAARHVGQIPLKNIADMLGHRDLSSSFKYTKVDFKALRQTALPVAGRGGTMITPAFHSSLARAMTDLITFKRLEGFDYTAPLGPVAECRLINQLAVNTHGTMNTCP